MKILPFVLPALFALATTASLSAHQPNPVPGRVGGAGQIDTRVEAHDTDTYEIAFHGGEPALIIVNGDGDTDLDLRVFDDNGNLVASDVDSTDTCIVRWQPRWTGRFRIEVQNLGDVYNRYTMRTN